MKNTKHMFMCAASLALIASLSLSMTAFADWKQEGSTWKYQNSDGKYATATWQWINGNAIALIPMEICMPIPQLRTLYSKCGWRMDCKRCCTDQE